MRSMWRSRVVQATAAAVACAGVIAIGYAVGSVDDGGASEPAPGPLQFGTIAPASLSRAGLIFMTPTREQTKGVPVSEEQAVAAAKAAMASDYAVREVHLAYWLENAGSPSEDDHLVWLVVEESPYGYYVSQGPPSTKENTAFISFVDPRTGSWLGAESFGR